MRLPRPPWLPPTVRTLGHCAEVRERLHAVFARDFVNGAPTLQMAPVRWDTNPGPHGYCGGFWHLVTREDRVLGARIFDPPRARRLSWCASMMANATDRAVLMWDYREGTGRIRTYVWLQALDYCAVLETGTRRGGRYVFLVTAFRVDGNATRRGLQRKYAHRI